MKRLISLILVLAVLSTCAMGAWAEGFTYEFENHSKSLIMIRMDTGLTVYAKNPDERRPMASMTKIMTYIVAYENIPDIEKTEITVDESVAAILAGTNSSLSDIIVGEKLTGLQLLNMMMVPSGNDAALVLAQYVDSLPDTPAKKEESKQSAGESSAAESADSEGDDILDGDPAPTGDGEGDTSGTEVSAVNMPGSRFIRLMNEKAKELGCDNTRFTNPHGLHYEDHYSTARDMAVIARYATTLPYFTEITGSTSYTLPPTNKYSDERTVYSTNYMFSEYQAEGAYYYPYTKGIKTGSLDESGYCIAASALRDGNSYIVIAMGSPMEDEKGETAPNGAMLDAKALFKWAFDQLELKTLAVKGDLLGDVQLQYAWNQDRLQLVSEENIQALLPTDVSISSIVVTVDMPEKVQAPVKKGDILGTAKFTYADEEIATINVVAAESVERSEIVQTIEVGKEVISSPVFLVIAGIIALILILYFMSIFIYNHKKKKMRKVKRYRNL